MNTGSWQEGYDAGYAWISRPRGALSSDPAVGDDLESECPVTPTTQDARPYREGDDEFNGGVEEGVAAFQRSEQE